MGASLVTGSVPPNKLVKRRDRELAELDSEILDALDAGLKDKENFATWYRQLNKPAQQKVNAHLIYRATTETNRNYSGPVTLI
jgi:hypothetical protein